MLVKSRASSTHCQVKVLVSTFSIFSSDYWFPSLLSSRATPDSIPTKYRKWLAIPSGVIVYICYVCSIPLKAVHHGKVEFEHWPLCSCLTGSSIWIHDARTASGGDNYPFQGILWQWKSKLSFIRQIAAFFGENNSSVSPRIYLSCQTVHHFSKYQRTVWI